MGHTPIITKDLPQHGLVILTSTHPSFSQETFALLKGNTDPAVSILLPYSIILKNIGSRIAIGYQLRWDFQLPDGRITTQSFSYINPGAMTDAAMPEQHKAINRNSGNALPPQSSRLLSLMSSVGNPGQSGIGADFGSIGAKPSKEALQGQLNRDRSSRAMDLVAELEQCKSITVTLDGVFFDTGVFVGPDTTDYFAETKAQIDAKRDLLTEISRILDPKDLKGSINRAISHAEFIVNGPQTNLNNVDRISRQYNLYKKVYAKEILSRKQAVGAEKAIATSVEQIKKEWVQLRKQ
jgi:hypothetical protein